MRGSGRLDDVAVDEVSVPLSAASFEEWFTRTSAIAGPLAQRREAATACYVTPDGLEIPACP